MPPTLLAVMFTLGVVDFDDQLVFRYILPERLVRLLVNKLELNVQEHNLEQLEYCN